MRKEFLKLMAVAISFSVMAVAISFSVMAVAANALQPKRDYQLGRVKQVIPKTVQVDLILPSVAEVVLKSAADETLSGRLIDISDRQIRLEIAGETKDIDIADISQILFRGYAVLDGRKIAIRGERDFDFQPLSEKLSNLTLIDPTEGKAQLELTSISNPEDFTSDYYYIVNEMSFASPETINIKYRIQP